jgi:hypothetical protein
VGCVIHPDSQLTVFAFSDDYSFGILQSAIHWAWFTARCSTLKGDFRYTSDTVFDTFPWPQFEPDQFLPHAAIPKGLNHSAQGCEARATLGNAPEMTANPNGVASPPASPSQKPSLPSRPSRDPLPLIRAVAQAAVSLRALRREIMAANGWSLRQLYRTLETPGANRLRDAHAALDSVVRAAYGMKDSEDTLAFLLGLNLELADLESKGQGITPPGFPAFITDPEDFTTADCIQIP